MDKTWVKRISGRHEKIRMYCFPHAGAGAYVYSDWKNFISDEIGVYAVKLPGREKRIREPLIDNAAEVCAEFIRSIQDDLDVPYVLFGHSMGGILVYETLRQLGKQKLPLPKEIIMSATSLMGFRNIPDISGYNDDQLADYLYEMGGTDKTLLSNDGFRECFFPIIRNDYKLVREYSAGNLQISVPVLALSGTKDPYVEREKLLNLKEFAPKFKLVDIEGGHFFIEDKKKICSVLNQAILEDISW